VKSFIVLAALLVALALGFVLRASPSTGDRRAVDGVWGSLGSAESDYRMRLVELSLATEHAPSRDRFLSARGSDDVPWPPLLHSALAVGFAHTLEQDPSALELRGLTEEQLEEARQRVGPLLALLAILALAAAASLVGGSRSGTLCGIVAAFLYAVHPLAVPREAAGELHAHSLVVLFAAVAIAGLAVALRGAEKIDVMVGALVGGVCAALGQLSGPEAWSVSLAIAGAFVVRAVRAPRERKREAWRVVLAYAASAFAVFSIPRDDGASWRVLPDASSGGLLAAAPATMLVALLFVVVGVVLAWRARSEPLTLVLFASTALSLACALVDRRFFAPLCASSVLLVALGVGARQLSAARLALLGFSALALSALPSVVAPRRDSKPGEALRTALRWLRERSSSPGAFNHPEAEQSWRVAAPAPLAGSVALHARRGLVSASFDGVSATVFGPDLLAARTPTELAAALARHDAPYLVLSPLVLSELSEEDARASFLAQLALDPTLALDGALESVYVSTSWCTIEGACETEGERVGPAVAIYRRLGAGGSGEPRPAEATVR
jgi:hypothetical protein